MAFLIDGQRFSGWIIVLFEKLVEGLWRFVGVLLLRAKHRLQLVVQTLFLANYRWQSVHLKRDLVDGAQRLLVYRTLHFLI
jgi:hypothetical protein